MGKKSFVFYLDNYTESMSKLTYEQKGMLFDAIVNEAGGIAEKPDLGMLDLAFDPIKATMKRDAEKYAKICERNKKNGKKGGRPTEPSETQENPEKPSGLITNPEKPDNENDNDKGEGEYISTDDSDEQSGTSNEKPKKCTDEDWGKYISFSERFLKNRHEELGKLAVPTKSKLISGAKALDNLIRIKKFPRKTVEETIYWGVKDSFWSLQLRSLGSLTKKSGDGTKFENLVAARMGEMSNAR